MDSSSTDGSETESEVETLFDDSQDLDDMDSTGFPNAPMPVMSSMTTGTPTGEQEIKKEPNSEPFRDMKRIRVSDSDTALTHDEQLIVDKVVATMSIGDKPFSLLSTIRYDPEPRRPLPGENAKKIADAIYPGAGRHLTSDDDDDDDDMDVNGDVNGDANARRRIAKARTKITEANFLLLRTHWRRLQYSVNFFRWNVSIGFGHLLSELKNTIIDNDLDPGKSYKMRVLVSADRTMKVEAIEIPRKVSLDYGLLPGSTPRYKVYLASEFSFVGPFTSFKTTNRDHYTQARQKYITKPEQEEVVLHNSKGEITEGTITNVAFKRGDYWVTPALTSGCLCGVARHYLVTRGYIHEGVVPYESVSTGDPVLLFNAIMGIELGEIVKV